jgi:hypothetical protein
LIQRTPSFRKERRRFFAAERNSALPLKGADLPGASRGSRDKETTKLEDRAKTSRVARQGGRNGG